jgi:phosphoserine phosphatase
MAQRAAISMSIKQRNDVRVVTVDRAVVEVIREQSLITLEANHHYFEEVEAFGADARRALARIYREAFAVLDAIGWDEREVAEAADEDDQVRVPLTPGHVEQLRARRFELGHANIDRVEHTTGWTIADLEPGREKARALDRLFAEFNARLAQSG